MKHINTKEELQNHIAAKGDPAAFYSIFSGLFRSAYRSFTENGFDNKQTQEKLISLCTKVYVKFIKTKNEKLTRTWFEKQVEKEIGEGKEVDKNKIDLNKRGNNQTAGFERELMLEIQRIYSRLRSYGQVKTWSVMRDSPGRGSRIIRGVFFYCGLILVLFAVIELTLVLLNSNLSFKYTKDDYMFVVNLPLIFQNDKEKKKTDYKETSDTDSSGVNKNKMSIITKVSFPAELAEKEHDEKLLNEKTDEKPVNINVQKTYSQIKAKEINNNKKDAFQKKTNVKKTEVRKTIIEPEEKKTEAKVIKPGENQKSVLKKETKSGLISKPVSEYKNPEAGDPALDTTGKAFEQNQENEIEID